MYEYVKKKRRRSSRIKTKKKKGRKVLNIMHIAIVPRFFPLPF